MFEIRFLLDLDALASMCARRIGSEPEYLGAFDEMRKLILAAAEKIYRRRKGQTVFMLTIADFS